jgi:transcriptional regulator with XRE-family HTH domain
MEKTLNSARNVLLCQMLQDTRIAKGLTQVELAAKLNIHQTEVSRVERGITRVDLLELYDFLDAMGVSLLDFVAELEERLKAMSQRNRLVVPVRR